MFEWTVREREREREMSLPRTQTIAFKKTEMFFLLTNFK